MELNGWQDACKILGCSIPEFHRLAEQNVCSPPERALLYCLWQAKAQGFAPVQQPFQEPIAWVPPVNPFGEVSEILRTSGESCKLLPVNFEALFPGNLTKELKAKENKA